MGEKFEDTKKFKNAFEISYEDFFMTRFLPMLGVIQRFMEVFGEEETLQIVGQYIDDLAITQITNSQPIDQIENFAQFKIVLMSILNTEFMKNATSFQIIEDTDEVFELRYDKCLWADTFKKLNFDGELGFRTACRADNSIANALHPKVRLTHMKTLMQGDKFCSLCYTWGKE